MHNQISCKQLLSDFENIYCADNVITHVDLQLNVCITSYNVNRLECMLSKGYIFFEDSDSPASVFLKVPLNEVNEIYTEQVENDISYVIRFNSNEYISIFVARTIN